MRPLDGIKVITLESARGMAGLDEVCGGPRVARVAFGTLHFQVDLSIDGDGEELNAFRSMIVLASHLADIKPPLDGVSTVIDDAQAIEQHARYARKFGFGGKLCTHPKQLGAVHRVYAWSDAWREWAARDGSRGQERGHSGGRGRKDGRYAGHSEGAADSTSAMTHDWSAGWLDVCPDEGRTHSCNCTTTLKKGGERENPGASKESGRREREGQREIRSVGGGELTSVKMSMDLFDEIAVEEAVGLKETGVATDVVTVSVGAAQAQETLRTALTIGTDRAILIESNDSVEPLAVAKILKAIVDKERPQQLIILGKQAIDNDSNQTGQMLAALANLPRAAFASKFVVADGKVTVLRKVDGGAETLSLTLPAVVTTDLRLNEPHSTG